MDALIDQGHEPVLLTRPDQGRKTGADPHRYRTIPGHLHDKEAMRRVIFESEAVIYNVGILREFPHRGITFQALQYEGARDAMDMAAELGVRRFFLTSANGARADGTPYQRTKYLAEEHLHASGLAGTVFRPSVIFGDPRGRGEFATQLCEEIIRPPIPAPLFHPGMRLTEAGRFRLSPIHVKDVVEIYIKALTDPDAIGKTYPLCGPDALEWRAILKTIGRAVGRNKWTVPVPVFPLKIAAGLLDRFSAFPITRDQLTMLLEGNTGDSSAVFETYGMTPTPFDERTLAYLN